MLGDYNKSQTERSQASLTCRSSLTSHLIMNDLLRALKFNKLQFLINVYEKEFGCDANCKQRAQELYHDSSWPLTGHLGKSKVQLIYLVN